jgi:hypothetical protein
MAVEAGVFCMNRGLKPIGIDKPGGTAVSADKDREENRQDQQTGFFHCAIRPYFPFR